jgi:hypothetical protein
MGHVRTEIFPLQQPKSLDGFNEGPLMMRLSLDGRRPTSPSRRRIKLISRRSGRERRERRVRLRL